MTLWTPRQLTYAKEYTPGTIHSPTPFPLFPPYQSGCAYSPPTIFRNFGISQTQVDSTRTENCGLNVPCPFLFFFSAAVAAVVAAAVCCCCFFLWPSSNKDVVLQSPPPPSPFPVQSLPHCVYFCAVACNKQLCMDQMPPFPPPFPPLLIYTPLINVHKHVDRKSVRLPPPPLLFFFPKQCFALLVPSINQSGKINKLVQDYTLFFPFFPLPPSPLVVVSIFRAPSISNGSVEKEAGVINANFFFFFFFPPFLWGASDFGNLLNYNPTGGKGVPHNRN